MTTTYDIAVTREGRWWMVAVPAIDGLTQARRLSEVTVMARELIAVTLDVALSTVEIGRVRVVVGTRDYAGVRAEVERLKAEANKREAKAARIMRDTAKEMSAAEVPLRDIGEVLGISHQRAAQLVDA